MKEATGEIRDTLPVLMGRLKACDESRRIRSLAELRIIVAELQCWVNWQRDKQVRIQIYSECL